MDWQKALREGVVNYAKNNLTGEITEPFDSKGHEQWLFKAANSINSPDLQCICRAVQDVHKDASDDPKESGARDIRQIMTSLRDCRAIDFDKDGVHEIYELMGEKIKHAMFHMAHAIYCNAPDDACRDTVVDYGSIEYFGSAGHEDEFRAMLDDACIRVSKGQYVQSHDW